MTINLKEITPNPKATASKDKKRAFTASEIYIGDREMTSYNKEIEPGNLEFKISA